jgi:hypothetical protein
MYICGICHKERVPEAFRQSPKHWRHKSRRQGLLCWWMRLTMFFPSAEVIETVPKPPRGTTTGRMRVKEVPFEEIARPLKPRTRASLETRTPAWVSDILDGKTPSELVEELANKFYTGIPLGAP